jgi:hypothetical protein
MSTPDDQWVGALPGHHFDAVVLASRHLEAKSPVGANVGAAHHDTIRDGADTEDRGGKPGSGDRARDALRLGLVGARKQAQGQYQWSYAESFGSHGFLQSAGVAMEKPRALLCR